MSEQANSPGFYAPDCSLVNALYNAVLLTGVRSYAVLERDVGILGHVANVASYAARHLRLTANVSVKQHHRTTAAYPDFHSTAGIKLTTF